MNQPAAIGRRARTDEQKELRRRGILEAADSHLRDVGSEAFSMAELGRLAGVAKGTLYLYFESREEVMLALYRDKFHAWESALGEALQGEMSDREFATAVYEISHLDPMFLPLNSRLDTVIEHNISIASLVQFKRDMASVFERLSQSLAPALGLSLPQSLDALTSLSALLMGTVQVDLGPQIDRRKLPEDVRQFMAAFSSRDVFILNACRILDGIRGSGAE